MADVSFPELKSILPPDNVQSTGQVNPQNIFSFGVMPGTTTFSIGTNNIKIDGANKRITVNDGSNDRVLIGKF